MRGINDIFRGDTEMSMEEKLAVVAELGALKAKGDSIDVMGVAISISPIGVDAHATGNSSIIEQFGLEKEFRNFLEEIIPIVEKYSKIVSDRYRADFEKFVRGGIEETQDELISALKSILKI